MYSRYRKFADKTEAATSTTTGERTDEPGLGALLDVLPGFHINLLLGAEHTSALEPYLHHLETLLCQFTP